MLKSLRGNLADKVSGRDFFGNSILLKYHASHVIALPFVLFSYAS